MVRSPRHAAYFRLRCGGSCGVPCAVVRARCCVVALVSRDEVDRSREAGRVTSVATSPPSLCITPVGRDEGSHSLPELRLQLGLV